MTNEERCRNVDLLNSIMDQAKFIRNILVHNSPNATIDFKLEVKNLNDMVKGLRND